MPMIKMFHSLYKKIKQKPDNNETSEKMNFRLNYLKKMKKEKLKLFEWYIIVDKVVFNSVVNLTPFQMKQ